MTKLTVALVLAVTVGTVAAPAAGQTLAERVAAIQEKRAEKEKATKLRMLQVLLYEQVTVTFDQTPARDVFDYLRISLDVNLIVRYSDDTIGHGIDPDTPITLTADGVPALELLELVLEQCSTVDECTWQLRKSFLEIGTKERLSVPAARQIRWYPVDEILFEAPDFKDSVSMRLEDSFPYYGGYGWGHAGGFLNGGGGYGGSIRISTGGAGGAAGTANRVQSLIDLIVELVEPQAWAQNGGEWASIRYREGALVVNAPPFIHRKIGGYPRVPPPKPPAPIETPTETGTPGVGPPSPR
ncbi:MAG: hypothetical protein ACYTGC_11200 [Planctomycetota bacterium]|jgi:hypothetical protein